MKTKTPAGVLINIGDRRLYVKCMGKGVPAVILDAGMGAASEDFHLILPGIARFTRVCSYDRAGMGKSDPAPVPRTSQDAVNDLQNLLVAAKIDPPYVLVGHSWSGFNVRLYAAQYPQNVDGMVLIDAIHEDRYDRFEKVLPKELVERLRIEINDPLKNDEKIDRMASIKQIRATKRVFDFPIVILTRGIAMEQPSNVWPDKLFNIEIDLQREFLKLSKKSKQIVAENCGHFIHKHQPELVVDVIHDVVELARNKNVVKPELKYTW